MLLRLVLVLLGTGWLSTVQATTCPNAIVINPASLPTGQALVCGAGNDLNATNVSAACGGATNSYKGGNESLYTFTPTASGNYTIDYTGQTWTAIFVYNGCPTSGGTCVGSIGNSGSSKSLVANMTAGQTYFIWFDTWPTPNSPCAGTFTITAPTVCGNGICDGSETPATCPGDCPPPPGDNCTNAQDLASLVSPFSGTTVGYTDDISTCRTGSPDRIFYIDVPSNYTLVIGEASNSYDEYEYIGYGATCPGTTQIACIDNDGLAQTTWTNTTGATQRVWYIQDGYSASSGTFTLQWTLTAPPACPAPTGLFSLVLTSSDVGVGWNAVSGATQYIVEYREVGAGTWTSFAGNPVATTNAGISGLNAANYEWQVQADCGGGSTSTFASSTFSTVPGNTCALPFVVNAYPFSHTTTTCGAGNDYGIQCSGLYGGGEDFVYQLDIATAGTYEIIVSGPTTYTGWFLKDAASCSTPSACLANATSGSGTTATGTYNFTAAGTYYLIVDHWPAPDCGAFTLTINPPTPAPGCSSNETATPDPSCSNQNLVFSWDAAPTATGYRISIGTTPGGTQIQNLLSVGNTLSYTFATPNINTTYYWTVTPFNLGGNATGCTEQSYTTGSVACHCVPTYTTGKTDGDLISNISITGTSLSNNTGTAQTNPAYTYFTGQPNYTATLQAGTTYSVNVTVGIWGSQHIRAWIDYNDNGVFEGSESIGSTVVAADQFNTGPFAPATFNISLSCSPPSGLHRMRVRSVYGSGTTLNTTIDPCANYGWGETEDYNVFITPAPACPAPFGMAASAVTFNSANLAWTTGCLETVWDVHVTTGAAPSGAANNPGLTATNLALTSLMPATTYNVYYRANCGPGSTSTWSSYSFTTLPAPPVNDEACDAIAFTRVETSRFGLGTSTLTCSSILGSTTDATNDPANGCGTAASKAVWYQFTTPDCFTGGNLAGFNMKFSTKNPGTNYDSRLAIFASSDNTCNGTFTNIYCNDDGIVDGCAGVGGGLTSTIEANAGGLLEAGRTYWVRVSGFGAASAGNFELTISVEPDAPTLTNSTSNPTGVIDASWPDVNASSYRLYWRPTGGSGYAIRTLTSNTFTVTSLMPNTSYDYWVNNWCGTAFGSSFASPVASLATAAPSAGCSVPVVTCGTSTPTTIMLNWPEVTGAVRIGARFSFAGQAGYNQRSVLAYTTTGGVSSFEFVGLQTNMAYTFTFFVECDGRIFWSAPVTCSTGIALPRLAADVHSFEYEGTEYVDVRMTDFEYFAPAAGLPNHTVDVSTGKLLVTFDQETASNDVRFTLTPNVTTDLSTLTIYTAKATDANINIFDMNGALVQAMSMGEVNNGQQVSLNTSNLAAGVYYVNLRTGNTTTTEKLVIVR